MISDEKVKESIRKRRSFSLLNNRHTRSQSSSSPLPVNNEITTTIQSSFNLETNKRGWLESNSVQVTPSRSSDNRKISTIIKTTTNKARKPGKDIGKNNHYEIIIFIHSVKIDILGAVSDEDIFKLTELTSLLPNVIPSTKNHNRRRSGNSNNKHISWEGTNTLIEYDENVTRKRNQQSEDNPVTQEKITSQQINDKKPGIRRPSISTPPSINEFPTRNSSEVESNEKKRKSWLYKSLVKPYKTIGIITNKPKENQHISASASIAEDYYRNNPIPINNFGLSGMESPDTVSTSSNRIRSNSSNMNGEPSTSNNTNRRHSFDSFHSFVLSQPLSKDEEDQNIYKLIENQDFIDYQDNALDKWEQQVKKEVRYISDLVCIYY